MAVKILILGGGFAGINAAIHIAPYIKSHNLDVKLVSRHKWSLFSPLLPDLISGRIKPEHIAYDLEPFCKKHNIEFIHSEIDKIDLNSKTVYTDKADFNADFILIAIGCETNYHGNENFRHKIPGLKSLHEGILIRNLTKRVIDASEKKPGIKANIIIVGAGYTGFEVASHIALYASQYSDRPFSKLSEIVNILMVEYDNKILATTTPGVQKWAEKFIAGYDVNIKTNVTVKEVTGRKAFLTDNSTYDDAFLIWTAGVAPGDVCRNLDVPKERTGRLNVNQYLQLPGHPEIFAAGDVAGATPKRHKQALRMSVQFSRTAGTTAAENILNSINKKNLIEYNPFDPGYVIPLGPGHAISVIFGLEMHGRLPFFLHYFMSVYRSWGLKNKYCVMKDLFSEIWPWPSKQEKHQQTEKLHSNFCDKSKLAD